MQTDEGFYTMKGYARMEETELTSAMEDYIEMIMRMADRSGCVHTGALSRMLHVTPPSVTKMAARLSDLGYVRAEKYGDIYLTEKGRETGQYLLYRHGVVCAFLQTLNGTVSELEQAEKIEHFLNRETIRNLDSLTETLSRCEKRENGVEYTKRQSEMSDMTEVVAALIWDGDKFMICQRPAHKTRGLLWEFVGGKVEPGETKEQALVRECREELDISVSVRDVFMEVTHEYPDLLVHLTLFNAYIVEGEPKKLEHNDIKWITVGEIPQYDFCPADEEILKKLMEK